MSLLKKAFFTTIIILVPIFIVFFYNSNINEKHIKEETLKHITVIAEAFEGQVYQFLEMSKRRVHDFSTDGIIRDSLQEILEGKGTTVQLLNDYLSRNKLTIDRTIYSICVFSLEGRVLASTNNNLIGKNFSDKNFFLKGKEGLAITEDDEKSLNFSGIIASAPIMSRITGKTLGVIANFIQISELSSILNGEFSKNYGAISWKKGRAKTMEVYLVNKNKLMITDSIFIKDAILRQKVDTPPVQGCLKSNEEFAGFYKDYRGVFVAGVSMCMPTIKWTLLVEIDEMEVLSHLSIIRRNNMILGISVTSFVLILFILFKRYIVKPLYKLSIATDEIAKGNYTVKIPVYTRDEIGSLANSFNKMANDIQHSSDRIKISEERLKSIINNSPAIIYMKDTEGRYILINKHQVANVKNGELIGKTDFEVFPKEIASIFWENDCKVLESKKPMEFEDILTLEDGIHYYISVKFPLLSSGGVPFAICSISTDITERKQAEEKINLLQILSQHISEANDFHSALNAAIIKICGITGWAMGEVWIPGSNGIVLEYCHENYTIGNSSKKFAEHSKGLTFPIGIGLPGRVWSSKRYELLKDISLNGPIFLRSVAALEAGIRSGLGIPIITNDRVIAIFILYMSEYNKKEEYFVNLILSILPQLSSVLQRKLSEDLLRTSEHKYRALIENLPQKIFLKDENSAYILCNENFARDLKIKPEEITGKTDYDFFPIELAEKYRMDDKRVMKSGGVTSIEERYIQEGKEFFVHTVKVPFKDEKAGISGILGIFWDITEKKRNEEERIKLENQIRQMQKMEVVGQLAGGIAHDFNNILTAIILSSNLLIRKIDNPEMRNLVEQILTVSERASNLVKGMLAFSRKQVLNPQPTDLHEIIRRVEKFIRGIIGEDIELKVNLTDKRMIAKVDSVQIEQVLINLATNARDAMPKGGVITINDELVEIDNDFIKIHGYGEEGKYAVISFRDTGIGVDEKFKEKIFEPFFTTKEVGKGTGLGLSMVYGIIKQHGGYINFYTEPNKGTIFKIYLPLSKEYREDKKIREVIVPKGGSEVILLAEDEGQVRMVTKILIEESGYKVIEAIDGEDAVNKFIQNKDKIGLIIFDMIMPKKSGKDAYEEIRKIRPDIKAIFMSGYTGDTMKEKGILDANLDFISKPITPTEFLRKIRDVLDRMHI
ncbi:MAG: PAS domain-containing protein [Nitrospinota bacterium]